MPDLDTIRARALYACRRGTDFLPRTDDDTDDVVTPVDTDPHDYTYDDEIAARAMDAS
jgi:hypothetical protein